MNIKRFAAEDMRTAIRRVREDLGSDAVILSTHQSDEGVEIVAAMDFDLEGEQPIGPVPEPAVPPTSAVVSYPDTPSVQALQQEMKSLRHLLESQLSQLAWNQRTRRSPRTAHALRNLSNLGITPALAARIVEEVGELKDYKAAWQLPLRRLMAHIPRIPRDALPDSGVVALVGPTGAGKTTAIARLAARHTLSRGRGSLALVCADNVRVGARDQLRAYGQILGAPVYVAGDAEELGTTIASLASTRLVLVDTAGVGHRDARLGELTATLRHPEARIRTFLTLPVNAQQDAIPEIIQAFAAAAPEGCIFTKIDEAVSLGGAISAVVEAGLPLAWLCNGQRVPEDMYAAEPRIEWLIRVALERLKASKRSVNEQYMAEHFEEVASNAAT